MIIIFTAILVCLLDRVTKLYIVSRFTEGTSVPVIPDVFHFTFILNRGAAFGILEGQRWLFLIIVLVLLSLLYLYRDTVAKLPLPERIGIGLLAGGAIGNGYDRFMHGAVIDFFDFRIWPIFNVADISICLGVVIIVCYLWRNKEKTHGEN